MSETTLWHRGARYESLELSQAPFDELCELAEDSKADDFELTAARCVVTVEGIDPRVAVVAIAPEPMDLPLLELVDRVLGGGQRFEFSSASLRKLLDSEPAATPLILPSEEEATADA